MSSYWMQTGVLFAGSYSEIPPAAFVLLTQFPAVASVFPPYSPAPISISPGLAPSNLQHVLGVTARLASFGIGLSCLWGDAFGMDTISDLLNGPCDGINQYNGPGFRSCCTSI
ncbi:hypothetical protein SRHO_G00207460 [Serrasalmus rhombeus]